MWLQVEHGQVPVLVESIPVSTPVCSGSNGYISSVSDLIVQTSYCALYDGPEGSGTPPIYYNANSSGANVLPTGPLTATKSFLRCCY